MSTKKLIGTIIGVIAFAALISGATFAWLTYAVNVTGGTYNGASTNFVVNYTKGTDISDVPILTSPTVSTARSLVVSANKTSTSVDGMLSIKLTTTSSDILTTSGAIKYKACQGKCADLTSNVGTVTASGTVEIFSGALQSSATSYYVYFWIDAETFSNDHVGKTYSGYISAEAQQTQS